MAIMHIKLIRLRKGVFCCVPGSGWSSSGLSPCAWSASAGTWVVPPDNDVHRIDQGEKWSLLLCTSLVVGVIQGLVHVHGVLLQVHGVVPPGHDAHQINQDEEGSLFLCYC
jgi:hypothetical protein